jgi:hypothetical protein
MQKRDWQRVRRGKLLEDIRLGDNSTPALATHIDQLSAAKELSALTKVPKFFSEPEQRRSYDPEQVWRAADALLQSTGFDCVTAAWAL